MAIVRLLPKTENPTYTRTWQPKADIVESKDGFTVTLDVPGFAKEDLKVKAHDGLLTVHGNKERETVEDSKLFRYYERPTGKFERTFRLPEYIETESIDGIYENGVLTIELKKKEEAKPHIITIK